MSKYFDRLTFDSQNNIMPIMLFADTFGVDFIYYQPHIFQLAFMFSTGSDDVDPGSVNVAVAENVSELGNILFDAVECAGKQMAKIVRKYLIR